MSHSAVADRTTAALAEDLLWLLLDDHSGTPIAEPHTLRGALAGAMLADLRLNAHTPDPLRTLAADTARRHTPPHRTIENLAATLHRPVLHRLERHQRVHRHVRRVFGLIPRTTWPTSDPVDKADLRSSLHSAVLDAHTPDPRTLALLTLLHATGTLTHQFRHWPHHIVDRRGRQITHDHPEFADITAAVQHATHRAHTEDYSLRYGF